MLKKTFRNVIGFSYDEKHSGNHYLYDGRYYNAGDLAEIAVKKGLGLPATKDANNRYDVASDLPKYNASVKSSKATLTSAKLANDFDGTLEVYFKNVKASLWVWVERNGADFRTYWMSRKEFTEFTKLFARWDKNRGVIRFKTTNKEMVRWLEER